MGGRGAGGGCSLIMSHQSLNLLSVELQQKVARLKGFQTRCESSAVTHQEVLEHRAATTPALNKHVSICFMRTRWGGSNTGPGFGFCVWTFLLLSGTYMMDSELSHMINNNHLKLQLLQTIVIHRSSDGYVLLVCGALCALKTHSEDRK